MGIIDYIARVKDKVKVQGSVSEKLAAAKAEVNTIKKENLAIQADKETEEIVRLKRQNELAKLRNQNAKLKGPTGIEKFANNLRSISGPGPANTNQAKPTKKKLAPPQNNVFGGRNPFEN